MLMLTWTGVDCSDCVNRSKNDCIHRSATTEPCEHQQTVTISTREVMLLAPKLHLCVKCVKYCQTGREHGHAFTLMHHHLTLFV